MNRIDCVILGHNIGNFQDYIAESKAMAGFSGAYRNAQINSLLLDNQRISYMDLFNAIRKQTDHEAEELSPFDPIGLAALHLASFLARNGASTAIVGEFQKNKLKLDELLLDEPLTVAITTTFYFEPAPMKEIVAFVRERSPETRIIIGGPYPSHLERGSLSDTLELILEEIGADVYVIDSQGESALARVVKALKAGSTLEELQSIPNLLIFSEGNSWRTRREPEDNPINQNGIEWSLFDRASLQPFSMMRTALSCPFACSFCSYPIRSGEHRLADIARVEVDLRQLSDMDVKFVYFIDDTFNVPLPRFKDLCRMIIKSRFRFKWLSYLRCGNMDIEAVKLAAESGCVGALLGIESGDQEVLQVMNKFASPDKYRRAIRWLEDAGIKTWALFFLGFPGDGDSGLANTISLVSDTAPSFYSTQIWFYDHATPIHRRAQEFDLQGSGYTWKHKTMTWEHACDNVDRMLQEVKGSLYVPQNGFSFETIFYLLGRGFSFRFVKDFLESCRDVVVDGLGDAAVDSTKVFPRLQASYAAECTIQTGRIAGPSKVAIPG
jgi:radical SAM PhpK family P-methyltransferase